MRIYVSGPMTGYKDYNYPAFHRVADEWRNLGHDVFCPAENFKGSTEYPWDFYMKEDLRLVMHCDAIVLLDGWSYSRGALMEALVAKTCGLHTFNEHGEELNLSLGLLGGYLKEWEYEHRNQRQDEVREIDPDTGTIDVDAGCRRAESGRSAQGSSSDSGLEGEEQSYPARLRTVRLRPGANSIPGIATGEIWKSKPAGIPMSE